MEMDGLEEMARKVRYRPRRSGSGFEIEDTRTKDLVAGEKHEDIFVANQAAAALERRDWAADVSQRLEEAGDSELAANLRVGIPRDILLRRLEERNEGGGIAAQILAQAPREP